MAILIRADGVVRRMRPAKLMLFTLPELERMLGGKPSPLADQDRIGNLLLIVDQDAGRKRKDVNDEVTEMWGEQVRGDVLLLPWSEFYDEDDLAEMEVA